MGYKVNLNTQKETEELMNKLSDLGLSIVLPDDDEEEKNKKNIKEKKEDNTKE